MRWLLVLFSLSTMSRAEELVRVKSHVVVPPHSQVAMVQLLDLAGVSSEFVEQVRDLEIATAPAKGERLQITNAAITSLLRPAIAAEKERAKTNVRVQVPNQIVIDTVKRRLEAADVREELLQSWRPLCSDCDLEIRNLTVPRVDNLVDWSLKLRPEMPRGTFSIPVEITREGTGPLPAWINGQLLVKKKVPVATRFLNSGERLQESDIAMERVDVTYATDGLATPSDLIGKKLRQSVRVKDPLWSRLIEPEKAVRRGELVRVSAGNRTWEVAIQMVAEQDAMIGETISLKNPRTQKILMGQVVAQGEVEIR